MDYAMIVGVRFDEMLSRGGTLSRNDGFGLVWMTRRQYSF